MLITEENIHTLFNLAKIISNINGINYLQIAPDHDNNDDGNFWHGELVKKEKNKSENVLNKKNIDFITSGFEILNTNSNDKQKTLNIPTKCYAHYYQVAIMADGNVSFCKNARFDQKFFIGNINEDTIEKYGIQRKIKKLKNGLDQIIVDYYVKTLELT